MPKLNFPEQSSPAVTELADGTKVYRTCSAGFGCHNLGCGMKVFVKDGELVKVEGDTEHPISQGHLCIRCLTAKEYFYHPDRILYPMKRAGKRGEDKWEQISWDEAFDLIIENYTRIRDTYGVNSTAAWNGTGRECSKYHFQMTQDVFGSINPIHPNSGWSCLVPRMATMGWFMGSSYIEADNAAGFLDRYDDPRWECPKYMLVWGRNPLRSNPDGLWGHSIVEMMKRGMKLIVADPRANWLAIRAEVHLQLRPGTDGALALGLLNVVIGEDLYDHDFVDRWCYGFEELAERVKEYPVEKVAEITGVAAEDIRCAARCLSEKPSTLSIGLAVDQNPNCIQIGHALLSLFAILGDMDVPGGCFMGQPSTFAGDSSWDAADGEQQAVEEDKPELEGLELYGNIGKDPIGHDRYPAMKMIVGTTHPDATLDTLETDVPYPIKFGYLFGHNPLACMVPQNKRWLEGMRRMDYIVVADVFKTPTIVALADLVLPANTFLEHSGWITNSNSSQPGQTGSITKILESRGESRSDLEIMVELHRRLYPNSKKTNWASPDAYIDGELAKIAGANITYDELKERVIGLYELDYKKYEKGLLRGGGQLGFTTPTGRIELYSTILQGLGHDPLPYYLEPKFSAISRPDIAKEYPLIMTTGARQFTSFHSENRQIKTLREIHQWPTVQINDVTAAKHGISRGDWVWIENPWGKCKLVAEPTPILKEEVISCDHGWWLPENDPKDLFSVFTVSVNQLIPHEEVGPLGFGTHYKSMPAKIYRAD